MLLCAISLASKSSIALSMHLRCVQLLSSLTNLLSDRFEGESACSSSHTQYQATWPQNLNEADNMVAFPNSSSKLVIYWDGISPTHILSIFCSIKSKLSSFQLLLLCHMAIKLSSHRHILAILAHFREHLLIGYCLRSFTC